MLARVERQDFSPAGDLRASEVRRMRIECAIEAMCLSFDKFGATQAFNLLIAAQAIATIGQNHLPADGATVLLYSVTDGLLHGRPAGVSVQAAADEVRMEFGRRRRAQLFEQGWIV